MTIIFPSSIKSIWRIFRQPLLANAISKDEAQRLARPRTLTPLQQELMSWRHCLYHLSFHRIFMLTKWGFLRKRLLKCQNKVPMCISCQFWSTHWRPWRTKGKKRGSIRRTEQKKPGNNVSIDQIISSQPGLIPQMSGFLTHKRIWGYATFVDHVSDFVYVHLVRDFTLYEILIWSFLSPVGPICIYWVPRDWMKDRP